MNIVVTGSLGHISKPLTKDLIEKGHSVKVISSNEKRRKDIETLGAQASIGTMYNADFLADSFKGADAVYVMEALGAGSFFNKELDYMAEINKIVNNYRQAIQLSGVKRVVHLSSIGAHTDKGNGLLAFHHLAENILLELPDDVAISFMRPVGFYYNLYGFIENIRNSGAIVTNYSCSKEPWVSPTDIAATIAQVITTPFTGRKVQYIASDELSCGEIVHILGAAIGKPELKWIAIPDEQLLAGMLDAGMNTAIAKGLVEMNAARRTGLLYEDYYRHQPELGKVKMVDFAKEFAKAYNQN